ncbi:acid phosphatase [Aureococcus anophagefferens]|nr:acid phosphatase [Aureococcus anophagefferens]
MFAPAFHATTADLYNASDVAAAMVALDDALRSAGDTARWLIVAGHWPMRSVSDSGGSRALLALLRPLFLARGVDAYVAGHDRALEHVVDGPLHHVVNGNAAAGGGRLDDAYLLGAVDEGVDVALATTSLGFTGHVVSTDAMTTTFYDEPARRCTRTSRRRGPRRGRGVALPGLARASRRCRTSRSGRRGATRPRARPERSLVRRGRGRRRGARRAPSAAASSGAA